MKIATRYILCAFILLMFVAVVACRREQPTQKAAATAQGKCPKLEGSYFGADKAKIKKGEAVNLSWKVPFAYHQSAHVEGLEGMASSVTMQGYNADQPPPFMEASAKGVTPEKTTKFILKANGPEGCPPLELPAMVEVE